MFKCQQINKKTESKNTPIYNPTTNTQPLPPGNNIPMPTGPAGELPGVGQCRYSRIQGCCWVTYYAACPVAQVDPMKKYEGTFEADYKKIQKQEDLDRGNSDISVTRSSSRGTFEQNYREERQYEVVSSPIRTTEVVTTVSSDAHVTGESKNYDVHSNRNRKITKDPDVVVRLQGGGCLDDGLSANGTNILIDGIDNDLAKMMYDSMKILPVECTKGEGNVKRGIHSSCIEKPDGTYACNLNMQGVGKKAELVSCTPDKAVRYCRNSSLILRGTCGETDINLNNSYALVDLAQSRGAEKDVKHLFEVTDIKPDESKKKDASATTTASATPEEKKNTNAVSTSGFHEIKFKGAQAKSLYMKIRDVSITDAKRFPGIVEAENVRCKYDGETGPLLFKSKKARKEERDSEDQYECYIYMDFSNGQANFIDQS